MLTKLYEDRLFADITIKLDDGEIKAHKCILAASNVAYFNTLFNGNKWSENDSNQIVIKDCTTSQFDLIIKAIYNYKIYNKYIDAFDIILLKDLLEIGDRFGCQDCINLTCDMLLTERNRSDINSHYRDILTIFMKFSPTYDQLLIKGSLYMKHTLDGKGDWATYCTVQKRYI